MFKNVSAVVLVTDVGEYEYRDGLIYAINEIGSFTLRRCYQPNTFIKATKMAQRVIDGMLAEQSETNVVEFRAAGH